MRKAVFKVNGRYNTKSGATVTIDRDTNIVTVRPSRMQKVYEGRLEDIAQTLILRSVLAEKREKQKLKLARRRS